jgi:AcrR family transcriptional regulator
VTGATAAEWKARPDRPDYEATRQRLVDAAEAIVREEGASALRLDSVADRVGLHRSSVYRYVDSKEALLTAVVVQATLRVGAEVIDALGPEAGPERLLVDGLALAMARIATDPVHRSLMAPSSSEAMTRIGTTALADGIRPVVEPLFATAAAQGVLREGVTPDDALRWLLVVSAGLFRFPDLADDPDELTRLLELLLVPALLRTEAGSRSGRRASSRRRS